MVNAEGHPELGDHAAVPEGNLRGVSRELGRGEIAPKRRQREGLLVAKSAQKMHHHRHVPPLRREGEGGVAIPTAPGRAQVDHALQCVGRGGSPVSRGEGLLDEHLEELDGVGAPLPALLVHHHLARPGGRGLEVRHDRPRLGHALREPVRSEVGAAVRAVPALREADEGRLHAGLALEELHLLPQGREVERQVHVLLITIIRREMGRGQAVRGKRSSASAPPAASSSQQQPAAAGRWGQEKNGPRLTQPRTQALAP